MAKVIVHGGANSLVHETDQRVKVCEIIASKIGEKLENGANALDACEFGTRLLEDAIEFNSGTGSYIQMDGKIRMDACIMDSHLRLGSVLQIGNVKNPVSVARKLMEYSLHSTLCGVNAELFAKEEGFETFSGVIEKQLNIYFDNLKKFEGELSYEKFARNYTRTSKDKLGTVGCIVLDDSGYIVAATSTGGLKTCWAGRVGDSGLVGAGNYANELVGVSCTGIGEKIMRISMARMVSILVEQGLSLEEACERAISKLGEIEGEGGIIAISAKGEIVAKYNTKTMSYAIYES